jgi:glycosyltransferase involved in cell wall biosynthesis
MAARKPVIVSDASGLAEVLTDGENALLVSPRSPDAIAASLNKLIANPQWAVRLGCRAQQLVRENFSWQKNAAEMVALFEEASVTTRQSRGAALLRPYTTQGTHS